MLNFEFLLLILLLVSFMALILLTKSEDKRLKELSEEQIKVQFCTEMADLCLRYMGKLSIDTAFFRLLSKIREESLKASIEHKKETGT